jgi:hypothetical protein
MNIIKHLMLLAYMSLGACVGPNPLLDECGEKW